MIAGDLLQRRSFKMAKLTIRKLLDQIRSPEGLPRLLAIYRLAELSKGFGIPSVLYFKTARHSCYDASYELNSILFRHIIEELQ